MILVVGGVASGKRTYLRSLGFADEQMADGANGAARLLDGDAPVVFNLQDALREQDACDELVEWLCDREAVACTEVGAGIVPVLPEEVAWRERVGRTCAVLAQRANAVVRMVCGIPVRLA